MQPQKGSEPGAERDWMGEVDSNVSSKYGTRHEYSFPPSIVAMIHPSSQPFCYHSTYFLDLKPKQMWVYS